MMMSSMHLPEHMEIWEPSHYVGILKKNESPTESEAGSVSTKPGSRVSYYNQSEQVSLGASVQSDLITNWIGVKKEVIKILFQMLILVLAFLIFRS